MATALLLRPVTRSMKLLLTPTANERGLKVATDLKASEFEGVDF